MIRSWYSVLLLVFWASLLAVAGVGRPFHPGPLDLVIVAFASYRMARILAFEPVAGPVRACFLDKTGCRKAIGDLISCPLCCGVWISAALTAGLVFAPDQTRVVAFAFAATGIGEFLNYVVSLVDWTGGVMLQVRNELPKAFEPPVIRDIRDKGANENHEGARLVPHRGSGVVE